ncbi:AmmeMemoRadiSam system protein B [Candidatus Parcubacteria bacterium]|jgi:MEMO1 family protein|nr:AmmeMemoRadiSam system protein B [Candidatus Parcubacteria bacterium]MBT3948852.1 AmmeMemoRadiSam system protein B [Candidatus Parcubacteria bacterium]
MPLVFAGITPHPPLLIPTIGKDKIEKIEKTKEAFGKLEQELYLSKPHIIAIISPHGQIYEDAFTLNAHTHFESSFEEFGDHGTKNEWVGAMDTAARIGHMANEERMKVQLISEEKLDHGSSVPLFHLTAHLPDVKILPIGYSGLDVKTHLDFGYLLKNAFMDTDKRVALIASGDLSHGLTNDSPAGLSKVGEEFDTKIIELLESHNTSGITQLDPKFVEEASQCGYRSLLIALGALQNMDYTFKNYAYEAPFGVGYLTGEFNFA